MRCRRFHGIGFKIYLLVCRIESLDVVSGEYRSFLNKKGPDTDVSGPLSLSLFYIKYPLLGIYRLPFLAHLTPLE